MATPFEKIDELLKTTPLSIVINALQQVCFTRAYEEKTHTGNTKTQKLYYDTGMALDKAVRTVNK